MTTAPIKYIMQRETASSKKRPSPNKNYNRRIISMDDKVFNLLEKMYSEINDKFDKVDKRFDSIDSRLTKLESTLENEVKPSIKMCLNELVSVKEKQTEHDQRFDKIESKIE